MAAPRFWLLLTLLALALSGVLWLERSPFAVFGVLVAIGCAAIATVTATVTTSGPAPSDTSARTRAYRLSAAALGRLAARGDSLGIDTALHSIADPVSRDRLVHAARAARGLRTTLDAMPATGLVGVLVPRVSASLEASEHALWQAAERISAIVLADPGLPRIRRALDAHADRVGALATALDDARASLAELLLAETAGASLDDAEQALRRVGRKAQSLLEAGDEVRPERHRGP